MPAKLGRWPSRTFSTCSTRLGHDQIFNIMPKDKATLLSRKLLAYLELEDLDLILRERERGGWTGSDIWSILVDQSVSMWYTGWWKVWAREAYDDMEETDWEWLPWVKVVCATVDLREMEHLEIRSEIFMQLASYLANVTKMRFCSSFYHPKNILLTAGFDIYDRYTQFNKNYCTFTK